MKYEFSLGQLETSLIDIFQYIFNDVVTSNSGYTRYFLLFKTPQQ